MARPGRRRGRPHREPVGCVRPDLDVSPIAVIGRVSRLSRLIDRRLTENFARFGIESWMYDVLATLRRSGEPYELSAGDSSASPWSRPAPSRTASTGWRSAASSSGSPRPTTAGRSSCGSRRRASTSSTTSCSAMWRPSESCWAPSANQRRDRPSCSGGRCCSWAMRPTARARPTGPRVEGRTALLSGRQALLRCVHGTRRGPRWTPGRGATGRPPRAAAGERPRARWPPSAGVLLWLADWEAVGTPLLVTAPSSSLPVSCACECSSPARSMTSP